MKIKLLAVILLGVIFSAVSVSQLNLQLNHPVTPERDDSFLERLNFKQTASAETIRVLAVMVDFVEDTDNRTSGNGKFDLSVPDSIIDSPPRNKNYFESHLLFLENYWRKVTNEKLIVKTTLLDSVYHLSQKMQYYSPPKTSATFSEIGNLVNEIWRLVDSTTPNFPFENFDAFTIFHAGVGRDVDLTSVYGYDPTPYDIPSIYFGLKNLQQIFGSSYQGVPVKGGQFHIKNSLVLPETENRLLPSIGGTSLLQLSINGLLAGTFGSFLGLPDLFNTQTGRTAIGRFGLMDGQSMFSWSGLFPPEPSAWEKYFLDNKYNLGFVHIIDIQPGENICNMPAVGLTANDTIYRVPINAREYFLMENRNRDANRNGSTITFNYNGQTIQKYFQSDTTRYNAFNQRDVFGVVTDVDEFDWSLPGGVTKDGKFFDGGILIWHIDENVIEANYASNTINANPKRRGVDLEEADGSQDLGQSYGMLNPGSGSEDGTSLDFWFSGNSAPVYKNRFSQNTHPNSMSYDFANSYVTIKDFTERSPRMSAKVILGDDVVKPLPGYPKFIGTKAANQAPQIIDNRIFISNGDSIFIFLADGRSGTTNLSGLLSNFGGNFPFGLYFYISQIDGYGVQDSSLYKFRLYDINQDNIFDSINVTKIISSPTKITTAPVINGKPGWGPNVLCGNDNGYLLSYEPIGTKFISNSPLTSISSYNTDQPGYIGELLFFCTTYDTFYTPFGNIALPYKSNKWELVISSKSINQSHFYVIADVEGKTILLYDNDFNLVRKVNLHEGNIKGIAISDLDNNGSRDVVVTAGRKIYAYNYAGILLDNFPITVSDTITSPPIIADVDGDGTLDVLVSTKNNLINAYSAKGKQIFGFPISISNGVAASMSIAQATQTQPGILAAMSGDGYLYAWELPNVKSVTWGNYRGNVQHTAFENSPLTGKAISEFFPTSRAYNWPNPVYDGKTNIRFYVSENSVATIKIFDMAGDLVDELRTNAIGGVDNEVEWNVSKFQSGVYYANIKVDGSSNSGSTIIKIAVVK